LSTRLLWALEENRPLLGERIAEEAARAAIGYIPIVGQIAGPVLTAAEVATEWQRDRNSWTAALMVLKKHT
jgi:hypothetical protein